MSQSRLMLLRELMQTGEISQAELVQRLESASLRERDAKEEGV